MIKILGYGNPFRRDDAIGIWVVSRLKHIYKPINTEFWMGQQLIPEISLFIRDADGVIFIDSSLKVKSKKGWDFVELSYKNKKIGDNLFHRLDIEDLLRVTKNYYNFSGKAYILAVMGYDFSFGAGLTQNAKSASDRAIFHLISFLKRV